MNYFQNLARGQAESKIQIKERITNMLEKGSLSGRVAVYEKGEGRRN
jgi:hypothetical protein